MQICVENLRLCLVNVFFTPLGNLSQGSFKNGKKVMISEENLQFPGRN